MATIKIEDLKRGKLVDVTKKYDVHVQEIAKEHNIDIPTISVFMETKCTINEDDLIDPIYLVGEVGSTIVSNFIGGLVNNFVKGALK